MLPDVVSSEAGILIQAEKVKPVLANGVQIISFWAAAPWLATAAAPVLAAILAAISTLSISMNLVRPSSASL